MTIRIPASCGNGVGLGATLLVLEAAGWFRQPGPVWPATDLVQTDPLLD